MTDLKLSTPIPCIRTWGTRGHSIGTPNALRNHGKLVPMEQPRGWLGRVFGGWR